MKLIIALFSSALALPSLAPLLVPTNVEIIPNEFIVQLKPQNGIASSLYVEEHLSELFPELRAGSGIVPPAHRVVLQKYESGYAAILTEEKLNQIRARSDVEFIEPNQVVSISEHQPHPENWGLDRISHRDGLEKEYVYPSNAGEGVDVYVVDTGINIEHQDFEGRAVWGLTAPFGDPDEDGNGHGTHVSSTIVGATYGIAKKARVIAVKVLRSSGYGSMSDVLKGVEWVLTEHVRKSDEASAKGKKVKSVANMSLGGGKSRALDRGVKRAIEGGVLFAVAGGNDNKPACDYSPAAVKLAITVGASTRRDSRSYFSNYGECLDIFAPGSDITAAWIGSKTSTRTISGTSMASPHVCGVMALVLGQEEKLLTPAELKAKVLAMATRDVVKDVGDGSPNLLLFNGGEMKKKEPEVHSFHHSFEVSRSGAIPADLADMIVRVFGMVF